MGRKLNRDIERVTLWADAAIKQMRNYTAIKVVPGSTFDSAIPEIYKSLEKVSVASDRVKDEAAKADLAALHFALSKWAEWKAVYLFDDVFMSALSDTEDTQIHAEVLKRLPFSSFYIHAPNGDIAGYFVTIEADKDCLIMVCEIKRGKNSDTGEVKVNTFGFSQCSLWFEDGQTIGEALNKMIDSNEEMLGDKSMYETGFLNDVKKSYVAPLNLAITCAYYLASQNADVKALKIDKAERPKRANGTPMNIKTWEVGFRMGQTIGKLYNSKTPDGKPKTSSAKRPHVRRAHWHHYWAGKGRTELRLNWVLPTIINAEAGDFPAVGHRVLKEDTN